MVTWKGQLCHWDFLLTIHFRGAALFTWREAQKLAKTPIHSAFSWTQSSF